MFSYKNSNLLPALRTNNIRNDNSSVILLINLCINKIKY